MAREKGWYLGILHRSGSIRAWHWDGKDFCCSEDRDEGYARYDEFDMEYISGQLIYDPIFAKVKYGYAKVE